MKYFAQLSLRGKLIALVTVTSAVALLVASLGQVMFQINAYRENAMQQLMMAARLVADSSIAPLTFGDGAAAQDLMDTLQSYPHLIAAGLYGHDGQRIAVFRQQQNQLTFRRGEKSAAAGNSAGFQSNAAGVLPASVPISEATLAPKASFGAQGFQVILPVVSQGQQIGTLVMRRDSEDLSAALAQYLTLSFGLLGGCFIMAFLMASRVQHLISDPIRDLVATADRVIAENDYSARAKQTNPDELGELVGRFNDMLGRVEARDAALQAAQDELEERVRERTSKLQAEVTERIRVESDLRESKQKAEASNRAKSIFLASMSHELRTPLNAIIGYGEIIQESADLDGLPVYSKDSEKIVRAGRHLLTLINEILDISKIEAGRMEIHPEVLVVKTLIEDVMVAIEPAAMTNNNKLRVVTENAPDTMYTDAVRFRQSLLNLLGNACKFTKNGTVTLEMETVNAEGRPWVECRVTDTGIGIARQDQHKLFQSFSQVDNSLTRSFGGTGLGLSISQKLCQMMGGSITVESELGQGSTFTMRLPAVKEAPVNPLGIVTKASPGETNAGEPTQLSQADREKARLALIHT